MRIKFRDISLDKIVNLVVFIYPLTALPQIFNIWYHKQVAGVSVIMWVGFLILTIPLLLHVIKNKDRKLTLMYSGWIIIYLLVLIGLAIYS